MLRNFNIYLFTLGFLFLCNGQEQNGTRYIKHHEVISIDLNETGLKVYSDVYQEKFLEEPSEQHIYEQIVFDDFSEVKNIKASTYHLKSQKKIKVRKGMIFTDDVVSENIYSNDTKAYRFKYPQPQKQSILKLNYHRIHKEPKLLHPYYFQEKIAVESSDLKIICHKDVNIGFQVYGDSSGKVIFNQEEKDGKRIYRWQLKNVEAYKAEKHVICEKNNIPHVLFHIKDYTCNGTTKEVLTSTSSLYGWYNQLTSSVNKLGQYALEEKALELTKGLTHKIDKVEAVFDWVKKNIAYIAYENGMGGFIPRDASLVFSRRHGDCKDMTNLLKELFKHLNIESSFCWIGTREKPYSYSDVSSPFLDNHMVLHVELNNKDYYLDATDKFIEFPMPTYMIQGQEVLVGSSSEEFSIKRIPIVSAEDNAIETVFNLQLIENDLKGRFSTQINGYNKSLLQNIWVQNYKQEKNIIKNFITNPDS